MNRQPPHWLAVLTAALLLTASASTSSWAGSGAIQRASIDETFEAAFDYKSEYRKLWGLD